MNKTFALPLLLALSASSAFAVDGNWMVRGRAIGVAPSNDGGSASIGGKPHVGSTVVPEVDVTYFATPNIGFELIAATTQHSVKVNKKPAANDLGSVWLLPPTLTAQYHFNEVAGFKPYVGAGITYAHFYDAGNHTFGSIKYDDKFGAAAQAGVDYRLGGSNFFLNADVKKIYLRTNASINNGAVTAKANIDPWIVGAGVGYRF